MHLEELVKIALERRRRMGLGLSGGETDSCRMIDGEGDEIPGHTVDCLAGHWIISTEDGRKPSELARALQPRRNVRSIWWKRLDQHEKEAPIHLMGERINSRIPIREAGLRYLVDLQAGYSQGIFLDQRENRKRVREASPGKRILNLFSYTCAFSVASAGGGAITTSLDLSPGYLDWGKENLAANDIDPAEHFFCKGDAFDWLRRFHKSGRQFDGVVIDPPTFSRTKGKKVFRVEQDYAELVELATKVTKRHGWLLCTTNCRRLDPSRFSKMVRDGRRAAGRAGEPTELPMPKEFKGESYLKSLWVDLA